MVVILSTTLAVFLVLAIVALIWILQILKYIKHIMQKAEQIADKAESVAEFFERSAPPVAIARLISNVAESVFNRKNKRRD